MSSYNLIFKMTMFNNGLRISENLTIDSNEPPQA